MTAGQRVLTEWGPAVVSEVSGRRVLVRLDETGELLNIAVGTPGYWRLRNGVTK